TAGTSASRWSRRGKRRNSFTANSFSALPTDIVMAHTTGTVTGDVERFAAWQRDVLEARAVDSEVLTIRPFRVAMSQDKEAPSTSWVTLVEGSASESETLKALPKR